ncbi:unnamed protein product [Phytophthora lilii]|uniref:Unnamed protein product n=1 Tax=Phytophthora lilii TaxID=2077276 RepID=A0A9W7DC55_9STRA|nr:unnamed protein product [Phytophthora lilii]
MPSGSEHSQDAKENLEHGSKPVEGMNHREEGANRREEGNDVSAGVPDRNLLNLVVVHDIDPRQDGPDHRRLVALLVHVLQRAVEHGRPEARDHDANELQMEAGLEAHLDAAIKSVESQQHEKRVADGVPELGDPTGAERMLPWSIVAAMAESDDFLGLWRKREWLRVRYGGEDRRFNLVVARRSLQEAVSDGFSLEESMPADANRGGDSETGACRHDQRARQACRSGDLQLLGLRGAGRTVILDNDGLDAQARVVNAHLLLELLHANVLHEDRAVVGRDAHENVPPASNNSNGQVSKATVLFPEAAVVDKQRTRRGLAGSLAVREACGSSVHAQSRTREHGEDAEEELEDRREAVDGVNDCENSANRRQEGDHVALGVLHRQLLDLVVVHDVDPHEDGPDHRRLITLLVHVLQRSVEHGRPEARDHDANKLQVETRLEAQLDGAVQAVESQQHEKRVADGVPELGDVVAVLVVELAPVDGGGGRPPEAHGRRRVGRAHAGVLDDGHAGRLCSAGPKRKWNGRPAPASVLTVVCTWRNHGRRLHRRPKRHAAADLGQDGDGCSVDGVDLKGCDDNRLLKRRPALKRHSSVGWLVGKCTFVFGTRYQQAP